MRSRSRNRRTLDADTTVDVAASRLEQTILSKSCHFMERSDKFHREMDSLEGQLPDWMRGAFRRARSPQAMWMRLIVATLLIVGGTLIVVLPVPGVVPVGLALLAIDVPFLRGPFARLLAFINRKPASQVG